jgi:hypothetical protein
MAKAGRQKADEVRVAKWGSRHRRGFQVSRVMFQARPNPAWVPDRPEN